MPSRHLQETLDSLRARGAKNLPDIDTIEKASNGAEWAGVTDGNDQWRLVKVQGDKYELPTTG